MLLNLVWIYLNNKRKIKIIKSLLQSPGVLNRNKQKLNVYLICQTVDDNLYATHQPRTRIDIGMQGEIPIWKRQWWLFAKNMTFMHVGKLQKVFLMHLLPSQDHLPYEVRRPACITPRPESISECKSRILFS